MLHDIYILSQDDCDDFKALNAFPENSRGPQVMPMSYVNQNDNSSVKMTLSGTPDAVIPAAFMFSDAGGSNVWMISAPTTLDGSGDAVDVYAQCVTAGAISAPADTLVKVITDPSDVTSVTNPFDAVVSGESFLACVDKSTIDNAQPKPPNYQPWVDAMEANQPISTREVITITMD